jgi:subtilisin-like proprotein convertase family protein
MKPTFFLFVCGTALAPAAVIVSYDTTFTETTVIPDNLQTGALFSRTITGSDIGAITSLQVTLEMSGGWNGDLYAYLAHDSGFAVLLNRIGRSGSDPDGSGSSGMTVTFDDAAASDIHTGIFTMAQPITGIFQPSGRTAHPVTGNVTASSPRTAFLSSFTGLPGDGVWELFVADVSAGDVSQLVSWTLSMEGESISAIPEPGSLFALGGLLAAGLTIRHRKRSEGGGN